MVTASKDCSSPTMNSSTIQGAAGRGGSLASAPSSCSRESSRNVALAPAPAGGLTTSGKPASSASSQTGPADSARQCRAQGIPAARSKVFICALSRKLCAACHPMPGMPSASRTAPSGSWSCSSTPRSLCGGPICRARPRTPSASCAASKQLPTRQCPARSRTIAGGMRSSGSWETTPTRTPGRAVTADRKRSAMGAGNGRTNWTFWCTMSQARALGVGIGLRESRGAPRSPARSFRRAGRRILRWRGSRPFAAVAITCDRPGAILPPPLRAARRGRERPGQGGCA